MRSTGNTDDILSALKASRLFSGIGDAELSKFVECSGTVLRSYPAGCVILEIFRATYMWWRRAPYRFRGQSRTGVRPSRSMGAGTASR